MSSSVFDSKEFDIESVEFVPGPNTTNEELAAIALALYKLTNNNNNSQQSSAWQIDALTNYDSE
jgi:hypothetical protein